jgi:hypothetical protein
MGVNRARNSDTGEAASASIKLLFLPNGFSFNKNKSFAAQGLDLFAANFVSRGTAQSSTYTVVRFRLTAPCFRVIHRKSLRPEKELKHCFQFRDSRFDFRVVSLSSIVTVHPVNIRGANLPWPEEIEKISLYSYTLLVDCSAHGPVRNVDFCHAVTSTPCKVRPCASHSVIK